MGYQLLIKNKFHNIYGILQNESSYYQIKQFTKRRIDKFLNIII